MKTMMVNVAKVKIPAVPFDAIKKAVLGNRYELTLVIAPPNLVRKINALCRNQNNPTDILSFPFSEKDGEIYLCPSETIKAAKKFRRTYENFLAYLFIHGCAHLKGHDHGATMERFEKKIRKKFSI